VPEKTPYPHQSLQQPDSRPAKKLFDCVVVGGGPAGLSAAIYLARYNRTVLVVDDGEGRSTSHEMNQNYLGFPNGIRARDLRRLGGRQAAHFGAEFLEARVTGVRSSPKHDRFTLTAGRHILHSRTLILATGVVDEFTAIDHAERYLGRTLFWCITCDGWKTLGKRVAVVGNTDEAATTCLQFLNFTDRLALITNAPPGKSEITDRSRRNLERASIPLFEGRIAKVHGARGEMRAIDIEGGDRIELDMMFNQQGSLPNVELAKKLKLRLVEGFVECDDEQRTNVKHVYAAGDVTRLFAHQIVTAAHEGATAAEAANFDLYRPEQKAE